MRDKLDELIKLLSKSAGVNYLSKNVGWFTGPTSLKKHYFFSTKYDTKPDHNKKDVVVVLTRWGSLKGLDQDGKPVTYKNFPNDFANISDKVTESFGKDKAVITKKANELAKQFITGYSEYTHDNSAESLDEAEVLSKLKFIYDNIVALGLDPTDYETKLIILKLSIIHPILLQSTQLLSQVANQPNKLITTLPKPMNQAEALLLNFNRLSDNGKDYLEKSLEIKEEFYKDGTGEEISILLKSLNDYTKNP